MPVTVEVTVTSALTGSGRCSTNDCSPWTIWNGSTSPQLGPRAPRAWAARTAKVGSTCWATSWLFSVVNGSSVSGSSAPAPTPSAYSSVSFDVHDLDAGSQGT